MPNIERGENTVRFDQCILPPGGRQIPQKAAKAVARTHRLNYG